MNIPIDQNYEQCWVTFLDIYGFQSMVIRHETENNVAELSRKLVEIDGILRTEFRQSPRTYRLSDGMFFVHPAGEEGAKIAFEQCLSDIRRTIEIYRKHDLPLRGGVAFGPVYCSSVSLIGDAVSRAVGYEKLAVAPVVIVPQRELEVPKMTQFVRNVTDIEIPEREGGGIFSAMVVVPRNTKSMKEFALRHYRIYKLRGPPRAASAWKQLIDIIDQAESS